MLNYHKTYRQSLDKLKRKATPKKQQTINRSHTSSINLKLLAQNQNIKSSFKQTKQNHDPYFKKQYINHSKSKSNINVKHDQHQPLSSTLVMNNVNNLNNMNNMNNCNGNTKYSFKIKDVQQFYDASLPNNTNVLQATNNHRPKPTYQQTSRVFNHQQTSRCLITDRNNSRGIQYKLYDRSKSKKNINHNNNIIKTQYKQKQNYQNQEDINSKFNNLIIEQNDIKIKQKDLNLHNNHNHNYRQRQRDNHINNHHINNNNKDRNIKDISTKHNTQSLSSQTHDSQKFFRY